MADAIIWRIARRPYALDRIGIGARTDGGRWNLPGTGVIYGGRTIAIAALEKFVHLAGIVPPDLVLVRVQFPDDCSSEEPGIAELPPDWDAVPPRRGSMQFGTTWAQETRSLVLYVPSALLREESNAVVNPSHPEFARVRLVVERDFHYDPRMFVPRSRV